MTDNEFADLGPTLDTSFSVSIVVATRDRPTELHQCLSCLTSQLTQRALEILVVDNNPDSGLTPPVVAKFPNVILVKEVRRGVSFARNAGISASSGEIVVTVDDDVTMPAGWLEKLVTPFARSEVMIVCGNVLPLETLSQAAQLFENYGGLGRGDAQFEVNRDWFRSFKFRVVPTWKLGGTANAAFRASGFKRKNMGLMEETLGPGTPTGVGEDTYVFYRWLKAGAVLVYEPGAFVWHKHRDSLWALHEQIYNYSKGHVAYHLTTLIQDGDVRALPGLMLGLPATHMARFLRRLLKLDYQMLRLTLVEIAGNLTGPVSLWRSRRNVLREGQISSYLPTSKPEFISPVAPDQHRGQL